MKSILITGSEGFIGGHLVSHLVKTGYKVYGIDRCTNLYFQHDHYHLRNIDILDVRQLAEFVCGQNFDAIVHLAALTTHDEMVNQKSKTLQINIQGTINLLEAYQRSGAGMFIYASTGKVYGSIQKNPISEDHPTNPLNILGKSKIIAENLIDFYSLDSPGQTVILRIFNVYGPRQRDHFLVPTILSQLANGNPAITLGNIQDKRDYIYVADVADAMALMLDKDFSKNMQIFNVGSGTALTAADIVREVGKIIGREIDISVDTSRFRKDECPVEYADTQKLSVLGWQPANSLREGLAKTISCYLGEPCNL